MKWVSLELEYKEPQFSDLNKRLESSESENDRISFLKEGNSKKQNVSHFTGNKNNVLRQIRVKSVGQKKSNEEDMVRKPVKHQRELVTQ